MRLLQAVNQIVTALGEHRVDSIETQNPTVNLVLQALQDANRTLQTRGWWFNRYEDKLYKDVDGTIQLPHNILQWTWKSHPSHIKGGMLVNSDTMSVNWDIPPNTPVTGEVVLLVPFEEVPEVFAQWVTHTATATAYINDYGIEDVVQHYQYLAARAESDVMREHLRHMRLRTTNHRSYHRISRHIWR